MMGNNSFVFRFADVEVHEREFRLVKGGEVLPVEPKAFRVLLFLLHNPLKLIPKDELLDAVWGNTAVSENSLARSIALLRRLLGDDLHNPRYIETVATVGYRLVCKVEAFEDGSENFEPAAKPGNPSSAECASSPANVEFALPAANPPAQNPPFQLDQPVDTETSRRQTEWRPERHRSWLVPAIVLLAVGFAAAIWYLRRPLPPLRITEYNQITHDGRPKNIAGTDGSRLYFNLNYGTPHNAQVAISGGEIAPVPLTLPLPAIRDVSPDGSSLLVASYEGGQESLWTVQVPGGSLRRLYTGAMLVSQAWSPDGKSIAYSLNGDIYVIQSDGTENRKVATVGGSPVELSWSPDGTKIRFSRDNRLWEISSDGTGLHPLLPAWRTSQCCGRWTPDGKFFVFLRSPFDDSYGLPPASQLWALDERRSLFRRTSSEPVQLTSGPIRWSTPIPSKDGTKIFAHGIILRGELDRYDAHSSRLQPWLGGISAEFVAFSPDGQYVAYVTFPEGILWRANRDGSDPVQLTDTSVYPLNPRWSPDGSQILFCSSHRLEGRVRAYVISSQGGTPQPILPEDSEDQTDPGWSADGHKIVFSTLTQIGNFNSVLRVLNLDSHQVTNLPGSEGMWSPRWSPNGRFIAGLHLGPAGGIKIFDFQTQRWTFVERTHACGYPTWSSNSQFIYCVRLWDDDPGVFRVRVSDGTDERVVDLMGFRHTGAFTHWMGLDPQDTPMLLRDVGTDDIYALTLEQK